MVRKLTILGPSSQGSHVNCYHRHVRRGSSIETTFMVKITLSKYVLRKISSSTVTSADTSLIESTRNTSESDSELSSIDEQLQELLKEHEQLKQDGTKASDRVKRRKRISVSPDQDESSPEETTKASSPKQASPPSQSKLEDPGESADDIILQSISALPPQKTKPRLTPTARTRILASSTQLNCSAFEPVSEDAYDNADETEDIAGFRKVPPPYRAIMKRELRLFTDLEDQDELSIIQKVIFSMKDPYSGAKIRLPVKSTCCRHLECFDFDAFCKVNERQISYNERLRLKAELRQKNYETRKLEKIFQEQQQQYGKALDRFRLPIKNSTTPVYSYPQYSEHGQIFHFPLYNKTPPLFKCPVCDQLFGIKQLYISDVFNFFIKTTPRSIDRIELMGMEKYRIIDETYNLSSVGPSEQEEIVVIDDSDSEPELRQNSEADFDDGLDDFLINLDKSRGAGSWNDPITLD